jgi:hypothetical protein
VCVSFLSDPAGSPPMSDDTFGDSDWPRQFARNTISHLRYAVVASVVAAVAWICFTLLYVAFWAHGFTLFQSIVVIVVSLVLLAGAMSATWLSFGLRWARHHFD